MGVEPGLKAVRGVSCHDLLRQAVPVWYSESRSGRWVLGCGVPVCSVVVGNLALHNMTTKQCVKSILVPLCEVSVETAK